ncbi:MAG: NapC/NirT family cytochrome c [Actinobacteria bacterium]|nr:NapC/NirT family cytochrome c [Actinomycetota bacterium]
MEGPAIGELINRIIDAIRQPELHTREIPIIIGLAILLVFIILVLIALIFVRPSDRPIRRVEEKQLKVNLKSRYIALAVVGLLFIASAGFAIAYTSKPEFCARCHEMHSAYKLSTKLVHKNIGCLSCHQEPGIFGVLTEKLRLIEMAVAKSKIIGNVTGGPVSNSVCLKCHKGILSAIETKRVVKMKHREPVEAGFKCLDCHFSKNLFHVEKRRLDRFGMSRCVNCHNQENASAECSTCHTGAGDIPISVNRDDYPMVNLPDKISCNSCHSANACLKCHSLQLPHAQKWKAGGHALEAFVSKKLCWECHAQPDCQGCHAEAPPHGDDWVKEHGSISKMTSSSCSNCHKVEEFCLKCHSDVIDFKLITELKKPKPPR